MSKFIFLYLFVMLFIVVLSFAIKSYKNRYAIISENYLKSIEPLLNSLKRQLEQLDIDYYLGSINYDIYRLRLDEVHNRICEIEKGAKELAIGLF